MDDLQNKIALSEGFQWDFGNSNKNQIKHGVSQEEAEQVFFNRPLFLLDDMKHRKDELRFHAFGMTNEERLLAITFTLRRKFIRIISARDMKRKEIKIYGFKERS